MTKQTFWNKQQANFLEILCNQMNQYQVRLLIINWKKISQIIKNESNTIQKDIISEWIFLCIVV